jgi:tRNA dimethylallyltransferase
MLICMNIHTAQPFVLIIYGPTGVGKTDIACALASRIPAEIVNMDVGQFYTPLSIGTAKPDWRNEPATHHLFDIINEPLSITVAQYRALLIETIKSISDRGNIPILVGGSGFYVHSLLFPLKESSSPTESVMSEASEGTLWQKLYAIDPDRAASIEKSDSYRIMRALEIWEQSGQKPTTLRPEYNPLADFLLLHISRETTELNNRINKRVVEMMKNGWVQEAERLLGTPWYDFIKHKKIIGYNEIFDFLAGNKDNRSYNQMIELISNKTRQYAKRQRTFWRKLEREINHAHSYEGNYVGCVQSINLTNNDIHLYINELLKQLFSIGKKK